MPVLCKVMSKLLPSKGVVVKGCAPRPESPPEAVSTGAQHVRRVVPSVTHFCGDDVKEELLNIAKAFTSRDLDPTNSPDNR